ncbi:MAG: lamin tail domain-containing protein [Myxococcaceae bacterium]|nr:lamin tail domain-containing protein [Myxococcaceae bacterium]
MSLVRPLVLGAALGLVSGFVSCGAPAPCTATSCPMGCCSADNQCLPGSATAACGTAGRACAACQSGQVCTLGACGAAATGGGSAGGATGGGSMGGGASGGGSTGGGTAGGTAGGAAGGGSAGGAGSASLVVNEVFATGTATDPDYVELFNVGTAAQDLSGFSLTDTESSDGGPKPREGVVFPAGTTLAPGGFLLVVADRPDAGASTECLGGPATCFTARFGLSQNGETIYVLDAQGMVFRSQAYPAAAAPAGSSYGRFPDGTGAFGTTQKTPGRANAQ